MRKSIQLAASAISLALLAACGGDGNVALSGDDAADPVELANQMLDELSVSVNGVSGVGQTGSLPFIGGSVLPAVVSAPDTVAAGVLSSEHFDLVVESSSTLESVYLTLDGAENHIAFDVDTDPTLSSVAVSFTLDLPLSFGLGEHCFGISIRDTNQSLSDQTTVCVTVESEDRSDRIVFTADGASNSVLATVNLDTAERVEVGPTGVMLSDIGFVGDALYGATLTDLYQIDADTGEATLIGPVGVIGVNALAGSEDMLYAATLAGEVLSIDLDTGAGAVIGSFGSGAYASGDLAYDDAAGLLLGTVVTPGIFSDELVSVDPDSGGNAVFIGSTGISAVNALAVVRGQLLGLTNGGEYAILNTDTGEATVIDEGDQFRAVGAAVR